MIKRETLEKGQQVKLTFVQPYAEKQPTISVLGDFNNWDANAHKLIKRSNGTASVSVTLPAGRKVQFRYCSADGQWFNDETADSYETGEFGAENSVVVI